MLPERPVRFSISSPLRDLKKHTKNWNIRETRNPLNALGHTVVDQAGNHKTLSGANSMFVSIRRVARAGIVKPDTLTEFAMSIVETSGFT